LLSDLSVELGSGLYGVVCYGQPGRRLYRLGSGVFSFFGSFSVSGLGGGPGDPEAVTFILISYSEACTCKDMEQTSAFSLSSASLQDCSDAEFSPSPKNHLINPRESSCSPADI
jgi:hypothetical protein